MSSSGEFAHPVADVLRARWSPRAFADRPVAKADLLSLLEAARWSPSCANEQPWHFIVVPRSDGPAFERLVSCLNPGNVVWAPRAPLLLVAVARLTFDRNGKPNRFALYDVGQAMAHLSIQATSMGLYVHQMAGYSAERLREALGIPEGYEPAAVAAIGYLGDPEMLPDDLRARELASRKRKSLSAFVFAGEWGEEF